MIWFQELRHFDIMYFSTYLVCIDINFDLVQIPGNTNKGDGKVTLFGSILKYEPFLYNRVYFLGEGDTCVDQSKD